MPDVTHEKGLHVYILYVNKVNMLICYVLVHLLLVICCIYWYIIDTYIDSFIIASISIYTYIIYFKCMLFGGLIFVLLI